MNQIYTAGYAGKSLEWLKKTAADLDAAVFDIRYSPRPRDPDFGRNNLALELRDKYLLLVGFAPRYPHDAPAQVQNYEHGRARIINQLNYTSVILLCECADPDVCHRTIVANMLIDDGYTVTELCE